MRAIMAVMVGLTSPADNAEPSHILVVDDDRRLRDLLRRFLAENGYMVTTAADAAEARQKLKSLHFDAIVLDVMMPGENGFSLTQALRDAGDVPILLLTAMDEVEHRITGLERGADDYLSKPFEPRELLLRLGNILRRVRPVAIAPSVRFGGFTFDRDQSTLSQDGRPVALTGAEAGLLAALALKAGQVMSRDELAGRTGVNTRTVDVQITRLRRKIEDDPREPRFLITVRGSGYMLRAG